MSLQGILKVLCGQADDSDSSASRGSRQPRRRQHSDTGRRRHSRSIQIDDTELRGRLVKADGNYTVHPFSATSKYVDRKNSAAVVRALSVIAGRPIAWKREREDRTTRVGDTLAFYATFSRAEGVKVVRYTSLTFAEPRKYPNRQHERPKPSRERSGRHRPARPAPSVSAASTSVQSASSTRSSSSATASTASTCQQSPTVSSEESRPSDATFTTSSTEILPPSTLFRAWHKGHVTTLAGCVLSSPIPRRVAGSIRVTNIVTASTEAKAKLKEACPFDISFPLDKNAIAPGTRVCFELKRTSESRTDLHAINVRLSTDSGEQAARERGPRLVGKVLRVPNDLQNNMQGVGCQPGVVIVKDVAAIEDHITSRRKGPQKHIDLDMAAQDKHKERQYGWLYADSKEPNGLDAVNIGDLLAFDVIQGDYAGTIELVMSSRPPEAAPSRPVSVPAPSVASVSSSESSVSRTVSSVASATATTSQATTTTTTATPPQTGHHLSRNSHMSRRNSLRGRSRRNSHRL